MRVTLYHRKRMSFIHLDAAVVRADDKTIELYTYHDYYGRSIVRPFRVLPASDFAIIGSDKISVCKCGRLVR